MTSIPAGTRRPARRVVLGAGGSARASVFAFLERGFSVAIVNRTLERAEQARRAIRPARIGARISTRCRSLLADADVLINNTSLGMAGNPPLEIDLRPLKRSAIVYDVVYVPLETALLKAAKARRPSHRRWLEHAALSGGAGLLALVRRHAEGDGRAARDPGSRHSGKDRGRECSSSASPARSAWASRPRRISFARPACRCTIPTRWCTGSTRARRSRRSRRRFPASRSTARSIAQSSPRKLVGNPDAIKRLEAIVHPLVRAVSERFIERAGGARRARHRARHPAAVRDRRREQGRRRRGGLGAGRGAARARARRAPA